MTTLRTVRLVLHPSRTSTSWGLVLRTDDGRTVFDRRLHVGFFDHEEVPTGVADVSTALRRIADTLDERLGVADPAQRPGAPGGGGGRPTGHRSGRVCAADCPLCGQHLDGMPSED